MPSSYKDTIASPSKGMDLDGLEAEPFIFSDNIPRKQRPGWQTYLTALHSIITVVLVFICIGLLICEHGTETGSFERGFKTELSKIITPLNCKFLTIAIRLLVSGA